MSIFTTIEQSEQFETIMFLRLGKEKTPNLFLGRYWGLLHSYEPLSSEVSLFV